MAEKNLSPRMKMISMMYLVLTALLALQVSSAVLDKFKVIDKSLETAAVEGGEYNNTTVKIIKSAAKESGNRKEDLVWVDKATKSREFTSNILQLIDEYREVLVYVSGGVDSDDKGNPIPEAYKGAKDEEKLANWLLVEKLGSPEQSEFDKKNILRDKLQKIKGVRESEHTAGDALQIALNSYVDNLAKLTGEKYPKLAYSGKEHPIFKDDEAQKVKDFKELNFAQTPMVAALAQLSNFKTEIVNLEGKALSFIRSKLGAADLKFDRVLPVVTPESNTVAAGAYYKADLFLAASASGVAPTMKVNGNSIKVEDGTGRVEFKAKATGKYDEFGLSKQFYKADIILKQAGKDTTFTENIEYYVAKPVIQIQSASVSALYLGCGNELQVNVPALGSNYQPNFKAKGGSLVKGKKAGLVTLIPNAKTLSLTVANDGTVLGTETFKVRPVPPAEIVLLNKGKPVNQKTGESLSGFRSLTVKAKAEDGFKDLLPKDARYKVTKWTLRLARGSKAVTTVNAKREKMNLTSLMRKAKPGDRLSIEIVEVIRKNYQNKLSPAKLNTKFINVPLK